MHRHILDFLKVRQEFYRGRPAGFTVQVTRFRTTYVIILAAGLLITQDKIRFQYLFKNLFTFTVATILIRMVL